MITCFVLFVADSWNNVPWHPNVRGNKSVKFNVSRLALRLSLPCPLQPDVKLRMKRLWRCSNYIWVINNSIAYKGATYIRGLSVIVNLQLLVTRCWRGITCIQTILSSHKNVVSWKYFPHYYPYWIKSTGHPCNLIFDISIMLHWQRCLTSNQLDSDLKGHSAHVTLL